MTDQYCLSTTSVGLPREHHQCGLPHTHPIRVSLIFGEFNADPECSANEASPTTGGGVRLDS